MKNRQNRQIQQDTHQVPCGPHSLIQEAHAQKVQPFVVSVYLLLNYHSNWDTGKTHALSFRQMSEKLGVFNPAKIATCKGRIANAIRWLVENGWLEKNVRGNGKPNTYKVIHHNCAPEDVPLDADGRPQKCAVPRAENSAFEKMMAGDISWKACLYHTVAKIVSDWTSGVVVFTIKTSQQWLRFSRQTLCDLRKSLIKNGLLQEIGHRARGFTAKILPTPYEKRRKRREYQLTKGMRSDGKYYYSYNERWRISRDTGDFETHDSNNWRFASEYELEEVNIKIYKDFMKLRKLLVSLYKFRPSSETS